MYKFLKGFLNVIVQIIFPYKLIGKNKIERGKPCVLVGNHFRLWDIVHMACVTKDPVHFIAKKELYNNKFIGYLADKIEAIPVSRDGNDLKAVMTALKYLKKGEKVVLFPEGTRNRTDEILLPLKGGAALFAIKAKVPVYPVVSNGKTKFLRRTKIVVGDAIDFSEFYDIKMTPEDYERAENIIRDAMLKILYDFQAEKQAKKDKTRKNK